jgi:ADP-ribose pyrophosphatase YjhB (NUDIX family)
MAYLDEKIIQKLAEAVTTDLVEGGIPLNDSISKLATKMGMTHEQIGRVCETSNNVAFNKIFKKRANASEDDLVDFAVADPKAILGDQIKSAEVILNDEPVSFYDQRDLQDQMHAVRTATVEDNVRIRVIGGEDGDLQIFALDKGYWAMPKGVVNPGENRRDAAARILEDATGLKVMPMNLEYVGMETFKATPYHTFTVSKDKLRRIKQPEGPGGIRPRIEYRNKESSFELRPESSPSREADIRAVDKAVGQLHHTKLAAEMESRDAVNSLRSEFRKIYDVEPFEIFEKRAAAFYGEAAEVPLNIVRTLMGKPEVNYDHATLQKNAGLVDDSSPTMQLLKTAIEADERFRKCAQAIAMLKGKIDGLSTTR